MQSKGEDGSLLEVTECILDLAFLMNIKNGEWKHLNCELQGNDKTAAVMKSVVTAFKAQMNILSVHLHRKKCCNFLPCSRLLNDNASVSRAFYKAVAKYSQVKQTWARV